MHVGEEGIGRNAADPFMGQRQLGPEYGGERHARRILDRSPPVVLRGPAEVLHFEADPVPQPVADGGRCQDPLGGAVTALPSIHRTAGTVGIGAAWYQRELRVDELVATTRPIGVSRHQMHRGRGLDTESGGDIEAGVGSRDARYNGGRGDGHYESVNSDHAITNSCLAQQPDKGFTFSTLPDYPTS